jgi:hypothetical protein
MTLGTLTLRASSYELFQRHLIPAGIVAGPSTKLSSQKPVVLVSDPKHITRLVTKLDNRLVWVMVAFSDSCTYSRNAVKDIIRYVHTHPKSPIRWVMVDATMHFPVTIGSYRLTAKFAPSFFVFRYRSNKLVLDQRPSSSETVGDVLRWLRSASKSVRHANEIKMMDPNEIKTEESKTEIQLKMADMEQQCKWNVVPTWNKASGPRWGLTFVYANWCSACKIIAPRLNEWFKTNSYQERWKDVVEWYMLEGTRPETHEWIKQGGRRLMGYPTLWVWDMRKSSNNWVGELERFDNVSLDQDLQTMIDRYVKEGPPKEPDPASAHYNDRKMSDNRKMCDDNGCTIVRQNPPSTNSHFNRIVVQVTTNPSHSDSREREFVQLISNRLQDAGYPIEHHTNDRLEHAAQLDISVPTIGIQSNIKATSAHANAKANAHANAKASAHANTISKPRVFTLTGKPMAEYLYELVRK